MIKIIIPITIFMKIIIIKLLFKSHSMAQVQYFYSEH